jgi:hypothetical protein
MKQNHWISDKNPLATWLADLTAVRSRADVLQAWLLAVVDAAESADVYTLRSSSHLDYDRARDGALSPRLRQLAAARGILHLFDFRDEPATPGTAWRFRVTGRMAYYDGGGTLIEKDEEDLGRLLGALRPDKREESSIYMKPRAPLEITGSHMDLASPAEARRASLPVRFEIHSDIWFPWLQGSLDGSDMTFPHDNRELANRHSPRLNQLLAAAREATLQAGGTWGLDPDNCDGHSWFMFHDSGVALDASQPPGESEDPG